MTVLECGRERRRRAGGLQCPILLSRNMACRDIIMVPAPALTRSAAATAETKQYLRRHCGSIGFENRGGYNGGAGENGGAGNSSCDGNNSGKRSATERYRQQRGRRRRRQQKQRWRRRDRLWWRRKQLQKQRDLQRRQQRRAAGTLLSRGFRSVSRLRGYEASGGCRVLLPGPPG